MRYKVVFTPEAEEQLAELYRYIATSASPERAAQFTNSIVDYCESLEQFPSRGNKRDDIRPGLRITSYRRRVVIALEVTASTVNIIGIFYGGQDYEAILEENDPN